MSRAVLSLGSNVGDTFGYLAAAVASFGDAVVAVSPVFRTPPWGGVEQQDFHNLVLIVQDQDTDAAGWLRRSQAAESAAARTRQVRWGPRTLDVDVITVDGELSDDPVLTLPHPRAAERAFVLLPWLAVDPDAELPGHGRVADLLAALPPEDIEEVPDALLR